MGITFMGIRLRSRDSIRTDQGPVASDEWQVTTEDEAGFVALAERLCESADPVERQRIKEELARRTFGAES
jgi:hypothetical protein